MIINFIKHETFEERNDKIKNIIMTISLLLNVKNVFSFIIKHYTIFNQISFISYISDTVNPYVVSMIKIIFIIIVIKMINILILTIIALIKVYYMSLFSLYF